MYPMISKISGTFIPSALCIVYLSYVVGWRLTGDDASSNDNIAPTITRDENSVGTFYATWCGSLLLQLLVHVHRGAANTSLVDIAADLL